MNTNPNIEKALEFLPIILGHSIHHELYDIFSFSRDQFDERFTLDCYKIIFQEFLGYTVTDSFILTQTKKIFGENFLRYAKKIKKKITVSGSINIKYEREMQSIPGGIEFARELAGRFRPIINNKVENLESEEKVRLGIADNAIAEKVTRQLSEPTLRKSQIGDNSKMFNCVKLSPLLSKQIQSSSVIII